MCHDSLIFKICKGNPDIQLYYIEHLTTNHEDYKSVWVKKQVIMTILLPKKCGWKTEISLILLYRTF